MSLRIGKVNETSKMNVVIRNELLRTLSLLKREFQTPVSEALHSPTHSRDRLVRMVKEPNKAIS